MDGGHCLEEALWSLLGLRQSTRLPSWVTNGVWASVTSFSGMQIRQVIGHKEIRHEFRLFTLIYLF